MKLNTRNITRKSGMTLLELTVVILVLLSLISILFVGAQAWKKGSDRAGCIMNLRNIQQAMRGDQNMKGASPGDVGLALVNIIGATGYINPAPTCPAQTATGYIYTPAAAGNYPATGTLYAGCGNTVVNLRADHVPTNIAAW